MTNLALDRSASVQKLTNADCSPILADAIVDVVSIYQAEMVTKSDFEALKESTKSDFEALKESVKKDLLNFEEKAELRWKAQQAESQVLVGKIEAIDSKLETKLESFASQFSTLTSQFSTLKSNLVLSVVCAVLLAVGSLEGIKFLWGL